MNRAYRLIWNEELSAWVVAPEIASARGRRGSVRRCAATLLLTLAIGSHATLAADLAATALPGGGQVAAGQATIGSAGTNMTIDQGSQRAIINWQNFDIGSQASVTFRQPDASAVALNRVSGPTASRIEGQLTANGQVFLINPSGVLFGQGARVNVGGLVASTLNIRDQDFLTGNYSFSGTGGAIENFGTINAAPGGYLAFIAPRITNAGTISAPQGTVALGAGERVTLNFAGNRLVGLSVAAETLDTLIENRQAIRAEGGAILLTAAGAEAVTRGVINNTGVLEASSLTSDGGRIVLTAGNDITLGAGSTVAVDGQKGGEVKAQAQAGTLLADGSISAHGAEGSGGTVQLLGHQVGLINAAQVDASGATGGGTVLAGGDYQGGNAAVQNAFRTYVGPQATIKADALQRGDGGKVVVWADDTTRYYGAISARGGAQGGNGGLVEVSGKQVLDFSGAIDVAAPLGAGGRVLLDPQNIVLNTTTQPSPPNNPNGTPDVAFGDPPAVGTMTIQIADITGFSELFLQATNDITVSNPITMAVNNSIRLEANNNITLAAGANVTTSGTGSINFRADADNSGAGTLAMNNAALRSNVGGITLSGASINGTGTINTTGAASANGGNIAITGTSTTGSINLTGAMTTTGGTAAANSIGRNAGNVTITGAGAVTTGAITANGSNGNGANRAGGNGGVITVTSNGALTTGNLAASGLNGGTGAGSVAAGGAAGTINVTNNSLTTGALTTGTLTARAGVARGAIVSGAAGGVNVTNRANTLLRTGAINTSGQAGGAGGNVALTSAGGVTVTSTIATSGGGLNAGTAAAGRNAGNVTIKGVNRSIAGAITASGGAAIVAGQAGGAGGNVLITGTDGTIATAGTLSTTGITTRNGNAVGTVASGAAGSITLEATQITATGALTTTGGANGDGGAITATTSAGPLTVNGAIAASGGTANANSAGRSAGSVTLTSSGTLSTGANTITANGSNGNGANQPAGNGGNVAVTSTTNAVTVGAISTVGGNGGTGNANGGNAGAITLDAGGATPSITVGGSLTATGGNRAGAGVAGSGGQIWLRDAVLLNAAITASAQGGSAGVGAGANVRFDGTINSTGAARALTVNSNAATIFGDAVGGSSALASLTTNAGGTTSIGGNITTTGVQTYNDAVVLTGNAVLTGTTPTLASTVAGGGFDLTLNFSGTTTVNGANFTGIRNLATGNGGTTQLTGAITTSGTQTYNDAVTLTGATTLASSGNGAIAFNGTVNGAQTLAVNTTGATTFAGAVGGTTALTSLTTNAGGTTSIGGNVTTTGAQTYNDAVILTGGGTRTFASTGNNALAFNSTVDGGSDLIANTTGTTTFAGAVGGTTPLTSVTTNAGGTTSIGGGSVRTTGNQTYNDNVSLGAPTTFVTTANGGITANGSVAANGHLLTLAAGLGNVVMQNAANDLATVSVTSATNVALRDANAIDLGTSTIGASLTVSAGGAVTDSGAISVAGATAINAGAANDVTLDNANDFAGNVSVQSGRNVRLNDINNLTLDLSSFGTLTATAAGTVTLAGQLTASGAGDAIVLAGSRFVNSAGATALSVPVGSRWLVWSSNPNPFGGATPDNRGGLAYDFRQYNATFGVTPVAQATGNGFLYTLAPSITPSLTGTVSKVYDGNTTATLAPANLTASGAVDGDTVVLAAASATYDNRNVGTGKTVTATGITATASNGAAAVYGYTVSPDSASGPVGEITPAALTVTSIAGVSTTYGTPAATGAVTLSGVVVGDTVTSTASLVSPTYSTSGNLNAGSYAQSASSLGGADAGNYTLTAFTTPTNNYTVGQLALTGTAIAAAGSTYGAPLNPGAVSFGNVIAGDVVTSTASVNTSTASSSGNPVVGSYTQTASALAGTDAGNYSFAGFTTPTQNYTISPAALTVTSIAGVSTTYGTPAATGAVTLSGVIGSDIVTSAASIVGPTYATSGNLNAGSYAQNASSLGGADAGNYTLTAFTTPTANYTVGQLALTGTAIAAAGSTYGSPLTPGAVSFGNVIAGDVVTSTASVNTGATSTSGNPVVGSYTQTAGALGGADAGNYSFAGFTTPTASYTINPLALTGSITANDKVYDATAAATIASRGLSGAIGSDRVAYSGGTATFADKNAGTAKTVTATGLGLSGADAGNYTVNTTATTTANITPAPLVISADDASRPVDTPNPQFTASYAGFVGGETPAVLNGVLAFSTPATLTSPVGIYPITPYGQSSGNYAIAYVDGKLTIQGSPVVTLPAFPREAASQQAIGAQYTDPTMSTEVLPGLYYVFDDGHDGNNGKAPASVVRVVGSGIRLPN